MIRKIAILTLMMGGLTACIDDKDDDGFDNARYQSPVGEWIGRCVDQQEMGLANSEDGSAIGDYKIESLVVSESSYTKKIEYFSDAQCLVSTGTSDFTGTYELISIEGVPVTDEWGAVTYLNQLRFETNCDVVCESIAQLNFVSAVFSAPDRLDSRAMLVYSASETDSYLVVAYDDQTLNPLLY
jgi:hypothetical protein